MKDYGNILVLAGGPSSEREISLKSGSAVFDALKRKGLSACFLDIKNDQELEKIKADIVFIALHGRFGEDGTVQSILEKSNIPYTGSGIESSKLALDKITSREMFSKNELKVPKYKVLKKGDKTNLILEDFNLPCVIKPQYEGSSIGLSIVRERTDLEQAIQNAFKYDDLIIVEEFIHGRELTVGILENNALPPIEIKTKNNVYDFDAKYMDDKTEYIVPAPLNKADEKKIKEAALKAHSVLGCRDFSRVDFRQDKEGDFYVLEVNTIPGMTERSLLPKAVLELGIDFDNLCAKLIELAYKRKGI